MNLQIAYFIEKIQESVILVLLKLAMSIGGGVFESTLLLSTPSTIGKNIFHHRNEVCNESRIFCGSLSSFPRCWLKVSNLGYEVEYITFHYKIKGG